MRRGNYKLIMCPGSGGWTAPKPTPGLWKHLEEEGKSTLQLYDMTQDLGEQTNLADSRPEEVKRLQALLNKQVSDGRTTPGPKQANDVTIAINKKPHNNMSGKRPNILFTLSDIGLLKI